MNKDILVYEDIYAHWKRLSVPARVLAEKYSPKKMDLKNNVTVTALYVECYIRLAGERQQCCSLKYWNLSDPPSELLFT